MVCFVHFDLEMCFAPQRRALFRHRNFQKWSEPGVFCTFSLGNVLRATTACTFSTSQLPKVVRTWCVLYIFTWKCASRHNGVHFFISHLASWVRTRRFSEPTFRPSGATNHWKNTVNSDFPTFSRICIFFLLIFSLLTLLTSAFQLSILSDVSLLNFLRSFAWSDLLLLGHAWHCPAIHSISSGTYAAPVSSRNSLWIVNMRTECLPRVHRIFWLGMKAGYRSLLWLLFVALKCHYKWFNTNPNLLRIFYNTFWTTPPRTPSTRKLEVAWQ